MSAPATGPVLRRYLVTLHTPNGQAQLEVPSALGPDAAARRAHITAAAQRWGDIDQIAVASAVEIPETEWTP